MAKTMKVAGTAPKSLVIRINLIIFAFFLLAYAAIFLKLTFNSDILSNQSTLGERMRQQEQGKVVDQDGFKMKAVLERTGSTKAAAAARVKRPGFVDEALRGKRIGMINMEDVDTSDWVMGARVAIGFERVSEGLEWKDLFPEWIDEEEENEVPTCPEIPMPELGRVGEVEAVVGRVPCRWPEEGWGRDAWRLQVHLAAAERGRDARGRVRVVLWSSPSRRCRPMVELFRCDDVVATDGEWWVYEADAGRLERKVALPVGSCELALPLWAQGVSNVYDQPERQQQDPASRRREAYATVLHSSDSYMCGALTLAQSLRATGTTRDLLLLLDDSIAGEKRAALTAAGWQVREIRRIRYPRAVRNTYNEYNYSKLRLWQLTDYDKVLFLDSDVLVLRNIDALFDSPEMSAAGNHGSIFNSGVMAIEPSNCTFDLFLERRDEVVSYNGGDQGFLNEVFFWWHRLPKRVNFLKNFWSNTEPEAALKNGLFGAEPPELYAIHYVGVKPWNCYRDYDCNWNIGERRVFASDVAHRRWWRVHDAMAPELQTFCGLTPRRRIKLDANRKKAEEAGFGDRHWSINVSDPRRADRYYGYSVFYLQN